MLPLPQVSGAALAPACLSFSRKKHDGHFSQRATPERLPRVRVARLLSCVRRSYRAHRESRQVRADARVRMYVCRGSRRVSCSRLGRAEGVRGVHVYTRDECRRACSMRRPSPQTVRERVCEWTRAKRSGARACAKLPSPSTPLRHYSRRAAAALRAVVASVGGRVFRVEVCVCMYWRAQLCGVYVCECVGARALRNCECVCKCSVYMCVHLRVCACVQLAGVWVAWASGAAVIYR